MMTTKYVIELDHHRPDDINIYYYYSGEADLYYCMCEASGDMERKVPMFDCRKKLAKRYDFEHEAIRDMQNLRVRYRKEGTFKEDTLKVVSIRCRV